jgi:hypothetical protein
MGILIDPSAEKAYSFFQNSGKESFACEGDFGSFV